LRLCLRVLRRLRSRRTGRRISCTCGALGAGFCCVRGLGAF
jgi:hypothetical protein